MNSIIKVIESNPTRTVRESIRTACQSLREIGIAWGDYRCLDTPESFDRLCDALERASALGVSTSDVGRFLIDLCR